MCSTDHISILSFIWSFYCLICWILRKGMETIRHVLLASNFYWEIEAKRLGCWCSTRRFTLLIITILSITLDWHAYDSRMFGESMITWLNKFKHLSMTYVLKCGTWMEVCGNYFLTGYLERLILFNNVIITLLNYSEVLFCVKTSNWGLCSKFQASYTNINTYL